MKHYWSPDLRLCYRDDTAVPLCDGATGQKSKAKHENSGTCTTTLSAKKKQKQSDLACWCKSEHGSYFPVIWHQCLAFVIRRGLPYFRLQSPCVSSHRLLEHIWHYRNTAEGELINSLLLLWGLPFGTHGFLSSLFRYTFKRRNQSLNSRLVQVRRGLELIIHCFVKLPPSGLRW